MYPSSMESTPSSTQPSSPPSSRNSRDEDDGLRDENQQEERSQQETAPATVPMTSGENHYLSRPLQVIAAHHKSLAMEEHQSNNLPLVLLSKTLALGPGLLPQGLAELVSSIALSAKISLRATAFFIEAILESARYGTSMGIGLTRRALVSAVSSARTFYVLREGLEWAGGAGGLAAGDAFLNVLDKYTNLGIYVITHSFTLAELFAMSGFYLTTTAVQTAAAAATESVSLFDGIFGSNETSRALASIITLVRNELVEVSDRHPSAKQPGTIKTLTGLTKALTAFACLQNATFKRTQGHQKMKVLVDCTVVGQSEAQFKKVEMEEEKRKQRVGFENESPSSSSASAKPDKRVSLNRYSSNDSESSVENLLLTDVRSAYQHRQQHQQGDPPSSTGPSRRSSKIPSLLSQNTTELIAGSENSNESESVGETDEDDDIIWELEKLVGVDGDEIYDGSVEPVVQRVKKRHGSQGRRNSVYYEITEQVTEQVEETRVVEHYAAPNGSPIGQQYNNISHSTSNGLEEEWIEVENMTTPLTPNGIDHQISYLIPSAPNGNSVATAAYNDALDYPHANAMKVQVLIKSITKKLLEKKRTVRKVSPNYGGVDMSRDQSDDADVPIGSNGAGRVRGDIRSIDWSIPPLGGSSPESTSSSTMSSPRLRPLPSISPPSRPKFLGSRRSSASEERAEAPGKKKGKMQRTLKKTFFPKSGSKQGLSNESSSASLASMHNDGENCDMMEAEDFSEPMPGYVSDSLDRTPPAPPTSPEIRKTAFLPSTGTSMRPPEQQTAPPPLPLNQLVPEISRTPFPTLTGTRTSKTAHNTLRNGSNNTNKRKQENRNRMTSTTSVMTSQSSVQTTTHAPPSQDTKPDGLFPKDDLVRNIHKFCRYASAAYGQNFLRILGLGNSDFVFPSTGRHHANSWAFAQHTNLPIDALLLSSFADPPPTFSREKISPLVHYISVDHASKAIVLTCRGTLGLSDVLVDLTCEYERIVVDGGDPEAVYMAHSGMLFSAERLRASNSTVHNTLRDALIAHPAYGIVLCGHSLGGGVAALLSILWSCPTQFFKDNQNTNTSAFSHPPIETPFVTNFSSGLPPGRPIHCYVYGPPCVTSSDLARHARGLVTSVVQGNDIVPTLSLGILRDFKNIASTLSDEGSVAEEIVARVVGIHTRKLRERYGPAALLPASKTLSIDKSPTPPQVMVTPSEMESGHTRNHALDPNYKDPELLSPNPHISSSSDAMLDDWFFSLIKTMRADMDNDKLYPPGRVYQMEHFNVFVTQDQHQNEHQRCPPGTSSASNSKQQNYSRREAHRVILRLVEDVETRFGELTFSKNMFQDHLPTHYEHSTQLLYDGCFGHSTPH